VAQPPPLTTCLACTATDDHPKHLVVVAGPGNTHADVRFHMDCHIVTSACEVCEAQLEGVGGVAGNPKGDALREHLLTTGPAPDQPGWTAPQDEAVA
jgi:hypothetical protein